MKRETSDDDFRFVDMTVRAADEDEFEEAKSGGYSFGYLEVNGLSTFVKLGKEVEDKYLPLLEQSKTRYKYFKNCELRTAKTDELLDKKIYLRTFRDVSVVLIY